MSMNDANYIAVLDHGFVRLVDHMGNDLSVVRAARVSYAAAWRAGQNESSDHKLINTLVRDKHTTPLESVIFTFEVKAPIFVLRQWHRHRTWSYNELSARYRELPEEFYIPPLNGIGRQSKVNKQARDIHNQEADGVNRKAEIGVVRDHCVQAFALYKELLEKAEWPRELARMVLPLNTYSHMFGTVNLHNLFHFLKLRLHPHAQFEIRVYAMAMLDLIRHHVPVCVEAWEQHNLGQIT